ncbi:hypothetical protein JG688_00018066 [Phytophthora aleatoria]|uniref:Uncharacterized protein n=1 Tax=Phytophthora aleatoria TaxID=2496075 RepID=A0A8J5IWI6_9STRA|nr:hypothetical protein JG688_00018066 [Phytophthora aleatoria]
MESSFSDAKMRVGPDGVYMEIFANKVLIPFDVSSTVLCHFYQKDQQNLETTDDTIVYMRVHT